jgi:hypothetical protein
MLKLTLMGALMLAALALSNTGCEDKAIGRPCDTLGTNEQASNISVIQALECPSRICLKPAFDSSSDTPRNTGPFCSAECSQDSDCEGQIRNPGQQDDFRCRKGFVCGIFTEVGPIRCKKLCLCKDFLKVDGSLSTPEGCKLSSTATP